MIAVASDHTALEMKAEILSHLESRGFACRDIGSFGSESCDYPVYAEKAARAVLSGECDRAVLICGTGVGMSIAANKIPGIRCAACSEPYSAKMTKQHNNANVLALGARIIGVEMAKMIVDAWLEAEYEGGRHARRVAMLEVLEKGGAPGE